MPEEKLRLNRFGYEFLALTGLMLLVALRFFPVLWDHRLYGPFGDNVFILGPMFAETARLALHGVFPYYLPSFGTGLDRKSTRLNSSHVSISYAVFCLKKKKKKYNNNNIIK